MADEEGESVQVAVRMRVFNRRELDAGSTRIIRMEKLLKGSNTYIKHPESGEEKKFVYDYSFQSHSATEGGIGPYATQDTVFDELGRPVMESALEGRNICLFAYGQTGAGKSYSMLGKPDDPGIIPRTCNAIFDMINKNTDPTYDYTVDIQVVEIYCEIINDLLADRKAWPPAGHKPRLTDKGYVVDTIRKPCFNYADIESAFSFADKNRSVGSHALNPESSRAHTIYTINYERKKKHESGKIVETVTSRLNLVDLAGSERTELAGTTGQMLKEGNAINLSLTALGSCIKCLSEKKRPNFRDSKLTLLLQGSMTNGRVVMIAAVSPAGLCYDESVSTLRFADRIKQVKIKSAKNVTLDPVADIKKAMEDMRSRMQAEIDALRSRTEGDADPESLADFNRRLTEQHEEQEMMKRSYEARLKELMEDSTTRQSRAQEIQNMQTHALGGASLLNKEDVKEPHFLNLHEDPRLAETLVYPFKPGLTIVGRMNKERPPDLEFNGMGIVKNHATIEYVDGRVWMTPGAHSRTLVNGKPIAQEQKIELKHNYRVWLGNNYAFRFSFPGHESEGDVFDEPPDYFMAEHEIAENASLEMAGSASDLIPSALNHKLSEALKKVEQANIIAMDLGKDCEFEAKIFKNRISGENDVIVRVSSVKGEMHWPWEKFNARVVDFVKEWQQWQYAEEKGEKYKPPPETEDPFSDVEYQLIGEADVWLQSLANMIEHEADASILAVTGQNEGRVKVSLMPCDSRGNEGPWDDDEENDPFVDDPNDMIGQTIQFTCTVHNIIFDTNISDAGQACKWTNVWIRYKINVKDSEEEWTRTPEVTESTFNPIFDHKVKHSLKVDKSIVKLLTEGRVIFQVWGKLSKDAPLIGQGQKGGKRQEAAKLDAEIAEKRRMLAELDKQLEDRKRGLGN